MCDTLTHAYTFSGRTPGVYAISLHMYTLAYNERGLRMKSVSYSIRLHPVHDQKLLAYLNATSRRKSEVLRELLHLGLKTKQKVQTEAITTIALYEPAFAPTGAGRGSLRDTPIDTDPKTHRSCTRHARLLRRDRSYKTHRLRSFTRHSYAVRTSFSQVHQSILQIV